MAKTRNLNEALEKYQSSGGGEWFSLPNDKDTAVVRFLYAKEEELDWYVVHEVERNGKKRWEECSEDESCAECQKGSKPTLKLFIQLIDGRDGKLKIWERGQKFIPTMQGLITRYGSLYTLPFEVERHGKKGDTSTTYQMYALDKDGKSAADFEKRQELVGNFILRQGQEVPPPSNSAASTAPAGATRRRELAVSGEKVF